MLNQRRTKSEFDEIMGIFDFIWKFCKSLLLFYHKIWGSKLQFKYIFYLKS